MSFIKNVFHVKRKYLSILAIGFILVATGLAVGISQYQTSTKSKAAVGAYTLIINKSVNGQTSGAILKQGSVNVSPGTDQCFTTKPNPCATNTYNVITKVTLTAGAEPGYKFSHWTTTPTSTNDLCGGKTTTSCTVEARSTEKIVTAHFSTATAPPPAPVIPPDDQQTVCKFYRVDNGDYVSGKCYDDSKYTCDARGVPNSSTSWPTCTAPEKCFEEPTFTNRCTLKTAPPTTTYTLTATKAGTGKGTVTSTSDPTQTGQISCTPACTSDSEPYTSGAVVTLTAAADTGSTFTSWSGDCSGTTTTSSVTMSAAKTCTATFATSTATTHTLTVTKAGTGTGTVTSTSDPTQTGQISCAPACTSDSEPYATGTVVALTATPAFGSTFASWSGCTSTTTTCSVTMDAAKTVTATFTAATGGGGGSICGNLLCESDETATSCPADCRGGGGGSICGNLLCESDETATSCPADCRGGGGGTTSLSLNVFLHGIGASGDNVNPSGTGSNKDPLTKTRSVIIEIFDTSNKLITTETGSIAYDVASGSFKGTLALGTKIPSTGRYSLKVKETTHLKRLVSNTLITTATANTAPDITLIAGDINNDNKLNILDYNLLLGCYSDLNPAASCTDSNKKLTDLNDDGKTNQIDLNLFLREIIVQAGD